MRYNNGMIMQFRKKIMMIAITLIFISVCWTQEVVFEISPEKQEELGNSSTEVIVRTNISGASVFLNNIYQGRTPLTIRDLTPGGYELMIEKKGYPSQYFYIDVKRGHQLTYYIELDKKIGWVQIENLPEGALVYVDGFQKSINPIGVEIGTRNIKVRKFGYNDFTQTINVNQNSYIKIPVEMEKAEFSISEIKPSKSQFNPSYSNIFGKCDFSFSVTAPEKGKFSVRNIDGQEVFTEEIGPFTEWEQNITWNGEDNTGNKLADGQYVVSVLAGGELAYTCVTLDSSIAFAPCDFTPGGTGIGNVATATIFTPKTFFLAANIMPTIGVTEKKFRGLPFSISVGYTPLQWLEISAQAKIYTIVDKLPTTLTFSAKAIKKIAVQTESRNIGSVNVAGLLRYGTFGKFNSALAPFGYDLGTGLSAGVSAGFETMLFYAGIASEYTTGAGTGNLTKPDGVWRNSILLQYRASQKISVQGWTSLHSAFKIYDAVNNVATNENNLANALDIGASVSVMTSNLPLIINAGVNAAIFFKNLTRIGIKAGVAWWF